MPSPVHRLILPMSSSLMHTLTPSHSSLSCRYVAPFWDRTGDSSARGRASNIFYYPSLKPFQLFTHVRCTPQLPSRVSPFLLSRFTSLSHPPNMSPMWQTCSLLERSRAISSRLFLCCAKAPFSLLTPFGCSILVTRQPMKAACVSRTVTYQGCDIRRLQLLISAGKGKLHASSIRVQSWILVLFYLLTFTWVLSSRKSFSRCSLRQ